MPKKQQLYQAFIERMENAEKEGFYFEACWYASAILEDRLLSLLTSTGGVPFSRGRPIRMLGPKLKALIERATDNDVLRQNVDLAAINDWKDRRNDLMHAMAEGTQTLNEIEAAAKALAEDALELVRDTAAAARRLKRNRQRVTAQNAG